jgi:hypothetical protein
MAAMEAAQTKNTTVSKKVRQMFGLDLDAWNAVMVSFLGVAAIAAVVVGVSTAIIIKLQKQAELESNERIAKLTTDGDLARKETAQAKLELLQLRFPRSLDLDKFKAAVEKIPPTPFEVLFDANAPDASFLASLIWGILVNAKWPTTQSSGPIPVGPPDARNLLGARGSWVQAAGGGPWGLSVVSNATPDFDKKSRGGGSSIFANEISKWATITNDAR